MSKPSTLGATDKNQGGVSNSLKRRPDRQAPTIRWPQAPPLERVRALAARSRGPRTHGSFTLFYDCGATQPTIVETRPPSRSNFRWSLSEPNKP